MSGEPSPAPSDEPEAAHVEARLDRFEAQAEDPVARFERMTGRTLGPPSGSARPTGGGPTAGRPPLVAAPERRLRLPHVATVAAVLLAVYGGLWVASAQSATPRDQLADLGGIEAPPVVHGSNASAEPLAGALQAVREARQSVLGLFPRYDPAALDAAAVRLAEVAGESDAGTWTSQEARLALARVLLDRQRDLEAARVLGGLVREGGYRAPVARRLLDAIRAGLE